MKANVLVVGEGVLTDCVCGELSDRYQIIHQTNLDAGIPEMADMALVLHDAWDPTVHQKAEVILRLMNIPWLRGFVLFGEGMVGPLVRQDTLGCSQCADLRRLMAGRERKEMWEIRMQLQENGEFNAMWQHHERVFCRWLT